MDKEKERIRKEGIKHGERTQVTFSFRCDNENYMYLRTKKNMGRWLNTLIEHERNCSE